MPVVTEFRFVRIYFCGEDNDDPAQFILGDQNQNGHSLKVFTIDGNAKAEAIKQLKGMIKCLEDIPVRKEFYIPTHPNCTCHLNITPCCPVHNERMH